MSNLSFNANFFHRFFHRAYPDMLEVGCAHGPGGASDPGILRVEIYFLFFDI